MKDSTFDFYLLFYFIISTTHLLLTFQIATNKIKRKSCLEKRTWKMAS